MIGGIERWGATPAFGRAVLFVGLTLFLAILAGRPEMAVLAAPVAIATTIGLSRRPRAVPAVTVRIDTPTLAEGADVHAHIRVSNPDDVDYDFFVARVAIDRWLRLDTSDRPYAGALRSGETAGIDLSGRALRWGRRSIGPVRVHAVAADGLLVSPLVEVAGGDVRVYPISEAFAANTAIARAAGVVGFHRSRRPGEGGELAGVRIFGPGDRLRRIDWRVSLRTRELHVASTLSDRDAEIAVLLDVIGEAGSSGGVDGLRSALDTTVRAAAGITDYYVHRGDRVGLIEYGYAGRRLRPASGHRHYLTALEWLLDVRPVRGGLEPSASVTSGQQISPHALIVALTPMLDSRSTTMLARLARSGRSVVAVDTMPPAMLAGIDAHGPQRYGHQRHGILAAGSWRPGDYTHSAARLWRFDRANTIARLREHGVPVVAWGGPGSLDDVLRQVARMALLPRVVRR